MPDPADLAARFNGTSSYINTPHVVDTNRGFSVTAWARVDQPGKQATVVSEDGTNVSGFMLRATAAGRWSFGMYRSDVTGGGGLDEVVGPSVQVGVWTHLAAVYSKGRAQLELYVNGARVGNVARTGAGFNASGGVQIGRTKFNGQHGDLFAGAIDDASVYSRPLFVDEIRTMAGRDLNLVHHWQLDEQSGTNAADSVGARGGVLTGDASFGEGRVGNAVQLNGVDEAVATTGADLRTDQSFTVSAWVRMNAESSGTAVSIDGVRTSKFRLGHLPPDGDGNPFGRWAFEMPEVDADQAVPNRVALSTRVSEIDDWVHLVGVYDAVGKTIRLYVDGGRQRDNPFLGSWSGSGGVQIGRAKTAGAYTSHWSGGVDDVRLYTGALDSGRVETLHDSTPPEEPALTLPEADAGHWKFDEGSGTMVRDHSGRGLDVTVRGGGAWTSGRTGRSAWFDGSSGYAETSTPVLATSQSFSVTGWAYLTSLRDDRTVFGQDGAQSSAFQVLHDATARRWAVRVPGTAERPETVTLTSTEAAGLGDWTHLAVVYDAGANELRLFVNGALSAARTGVTVPASEGAFTIGRGKWNGVNTGFFPRGIDDVRAFGRVLTDGQVRRVHADVPWAERGSWRFDDGTLRDYSWRANNAAATPVVSFEPGISGTGLRLDGTTGSATTPTAGATMRDNFTVSAWARLDRGDRVATVVGQDGSRMSGFSLQYRPESNRWAFGARATDSDGAAMVSAVAATPARLSEWVHLTGVYDSGARQLRLYVDGKLSGIRTHGPLWLAAGGLTIGRGKVDGKSRIHAERRFQG